MKDGAVLLVRYSPTKFVNEDSPAYGEWRGLNGHFFARRIVAGPPLTDTVTFDFLPPEEAGM